MKFVATKNGMTTNFFHPSLLLLFLHPGSEIWDQGWVKIRIRDKHPGSATLEQSCTWILSQSSEVRRCSTVHHKVRDPGPLSPQIRI
jgi:hypothetical protein